MKISDIEVSAYSAPYDLPHANGKYTYSTTDVVICKVCTDEGVDGIGWAHGTEVVYDTMMNLKKRIIGEDPFNVERIWEKMYLPKVFGRKGFETRAISGIDTALWDIMGKVAGRSVHQLLGGYHSSVPAYIAGGYYIEGKSQADLQKEMAGNVSKGARAVKMKIGGAPIAVDLDRIDAVREAIGPNCMLLVDANNAYNRIDALKMGRELDKRNIYWYEEPVSPDDIEGCAELSRKLDTPIAIGENEYTRWGFKQLIDAHAAQVLNADALVLGGITEWRKVAALAQAAHVLLAPHGDQEVHVHLVSAVSNGLIAEYYDTNLNTLLHTMFRQHMVLDGEGRLTPPNRPGLGVEINFDGLEPYRVYPKKN